tara:strand:+ start:166 stop:633 length:468 start_codon:yes stop_codon:yes gene_type:complete
MASKISSSGITDGSRITAAQITQVTDALSGVSAYDITISGSLNLTGSSPVTGSFSGDGSSLIGVISSSHAVTSSYSVYAATALSSSYATTSSHATSGTGSFGGALSGTLTNSAGYITLTYVSESLEFASDLKAEEFGVPLGGLYRTGSNIKIRMS